MNLLRKFTRTNNNKSNGWGDHHVTPTPLKSTSDHTPKNAHCVKIAFIIPLRRSHKIMYLSLISSPKINTDPKYFTITPPPPIRYRIETCLCTSYYLDKIYLYFTSYSSVNYRRIRLKFPR